MPQVRRDRPLQFRGRHPIHAGRGPAEVPTCFNSTSGQSAIYARSSDEGRQRNEVEGVAGAILEVLSVLDQEVLEGGDLRRDDHIRRVECGGEGAGKAGVRHCQEVQGAQGVFGIFIIGKPFLTLGRRHQRSMRLQFDVHRGLYEGSGTGLQRHGR